MSPVNQNSGGKVSNINQQSEMNNYEDTNILNIQEPYDEKEVPLSNKVDSIIDIQEQPINEFTDVPLKNKYGKNNIVFGPKLSRGNEVKLTMQRKRL